MWKGEQNVIPFTECQPTLENYWRSIILFGRNVASYRSLLDLARQGKEVVTLEQLAKPSHATCASTCELRSPPRLTARTD